MNIIEANIVEVVDPVLNYSLENFPEINSEEWSINSVVSKCNKVTVSVTDETHFQLTPKEIINFTDVITINLVYTNDGTPDFFTYRTVEFGLKVIANNLLTWDVTNNNNFDVSVGFTKNSYSNPISIYTAVGTRKPKKENFTEQTDAFMLNLHPGETLYMFSESMTVYGVSFYNAGLVFTCSADVSFGGNIMAMLKDQTLSNYGLSYLFKNNDKITTAPALPATTLANSCYENMFYGCTALTTAPALPAETLADGCYSHMFYGCTSLTTAPALPATMTTATCYDAMFYNCTSLTTAPANLPATAALIGCYREMFSNCTSLTTAPALPATTLYSECYRKMFSGCTSLTTAPVTLPATTVSNYSYANMFDGCVALTTAPAISATNVAQYCCMYMFRGCTSLVNAPSTLPDTTLVNNCYSGMFLGCTSLTTAPELPATSLADYCYSTMFNGCSNLNYIKAMFTNYSATALFSWVTNVSSSGTFVMNASAVYDPESIRGTSGIPANWTVLTAAS